MFMKLTISEDRSGRSGWAPVTETATNAQTRATENILQDSSPFSQNILVEITDKIVKKILNGSRQIWVKISLLGHKQPLSKHR